MCWTRTEPKPRWKTGTSFPNRYGIYWMEGVQRALLQEETKVRGWGRELLHAKSTQLRSPGVKTGCETQNSSTFGARV